MSDLDLYELRDELSDFAQPAKQVGRSPREERIIAGFEEIERFVEQHGRAPQHGEDRDIFERLDPTFLMADVEVVATYNLFNINRTRLEILIHRILDSARLDIEVKDRFGNPVVPQEWFLVPLFAIDQAVAKIKDGTITDVVYDPSTARLTNA